jgi:hypothetical protein
MVPFPCESEEGEIVSFLATGDSFAPGIFNPPSKIGREWPHGVAEMASRHCLKVSDLLAIIQEYDMISEKVGRQGQCRNNFLTYPRFALAVLHVKRFKSSMFFAFIQFRGPLMPFLRPLSSFTPSHHGPQNSTSSTVNANNVFDNLHLTLVRIRTEGFR